MLKQSKKVSFFKKMMPHKEIIIDQYGVPNSGKNNTQIKNPRKIAIRVPVNAAKSGQANGQTRILNYISHLKWGLPSWNCVPKILPRDVGKNYLVSCSSSVFGERPKNICTVF